MGRVAAFLCVLAIGYTAKAQDYNENFDSFRREMLNNYSRFRKSVLDDYAKYLNGIWKDYEAFRGLKKDIGPKPVTPPVKTPNDNVAPVVVKPKVKPNPVEPKVPKPSTPLSPKPTNPLPEKPVLPIIQEPSAPKVERIPVKWCGMTFDMPKANFDYRLYATNNQSISDYWRKLDASSVKKNSLNALKEMSMTMGLNGWLTMQFAMDYVRQSLRCNNNEVMLVTHYLLANMGYDVRLAKSNDNISLLVPTCDGQTIYEMGYIMLSGRKYYIVGDISSGTFSTYDMPKDVDCGRTFDMQIKTGLNLPYKAHSFRLHGANITITGEVNENAIKVINSYPGLSIPMCASCIIDKKSREIVLRQLKNAIDGMTQVQAVNTILHFIHGLNYLTDDQQFGREKYFYFEETLFYPACDCEDRSIFFSYVIKELLGLDVHLLFYPGHCATAVRLTDMVNGDYYMWKGKKYVICDPTYIGANIGMCMPQYKKIQPEVLNP